MIKLVCRRLRRFLFGVLPLLSVASLSAATPPASPQGPGSQPIFGSEGWIVAYDRLAFSQTLGRRPMNLAGLEDAIRRLKGFPCE